MPAPCPLIGLWTGPIQNPACKADSGGRKASRHARTQEGISRERDEQAGRGGGGDPGGAGVP